MDRDIALSMVQSLTIIKNTLHELATNTTPAEPSEAASLSLAPLMTGALDPETVAPVEDFGVSPEEPEAPEADPEEPETRTKK